MIPSNDNTLPLIPIPNIKLAPDHYPGTPHALLYLQANWASQYRTFYSELIEYYIGFHGSSMATLLKDKLSGIIRGEPTLDVDIIFCAMALALLKDCYQAEAIRHGKRMSTENDNNTYFEIH